MIKAILNGIFTLVKFFISVFFDPLFSIIESLFPDLSNVFTFVNQMLTLCLSVVGYVLDAINLPTLVYDAIFISLAFRFTLSFYGSISKKVIKWWSAIVP